MIVMKFGGTSVGNAKRIKNVAEIVKTRLADNPVTVVSALGGVTDDLIQMAKNVVNGKQAKGELEKVINRHYATIDELGLERAIISGEVEELGRIADEIERVACLTTEMQDRLMSFGERMSARIIAGYMSHAGLNAGAYDAYDLGLLTDSNFGNADILPGIYNIIRERLAKSEKLAVITGFIGKDMDGNITTLGRGGSDYTASIIGAAIKATEIQIWTDVNGIMTADPKVVKDAKSLDVVSYDEASELAVLGAKILHPKTMLPAIENNIPVRILNTFNPKHKGTLVLKKVAGLENRVASIAYKKHMRVINVSASGLSPMHGFVPSVVGIFNKYGIDVEMVSTSKANLSVTIGGKQDISKLIAELSKTANVEVRSNCTKISLVGNGLYYKPGVLGTLLSSLKDINTELVYSSTSEIHQSFVVNGGDADRTIRRLHQAFFQEIR